MMMIVMNIFIRCPWR